MKLNIFNPLRNLLRMLVDNPAQDLSGPEPAVSPSSRRPIVMAPRARTAPAETTGIRQNGRGVELPLQPILAGLPHDLQPRLTQTDPGPLSISIPLEKVLAQLSRGAVQISFGELRQAAPDCFTPENDRDRMLIPLPLGEILSRLNPALITRRRTQKQVHVPADIASPFDQRNRGLIFSVGPAKPPSAPTPAPVQPQRQVTVPAPTPPPAPARAGFAFAPKPTPPTAKPPAAPALSPVAHTLQETGPRPAPVTVPAPAAPVPAAPAPAPVKPASDASPVQVGLTSLAESWPEAIRQEIVQLNLLEARVALPHHVAERALKQGRLAFTWKTLRSWIWPAPLPAVSAHDSTVLELPLKVIAPLFLARQKETARVQKKVAIDEEIPNLFFNVPPSGAAAPPVAPPAGPASAKPQDTNFYVWDDTTDTVRLREEDVKKPPSPGTKFVAKYATPNEVVSRAAALDGVAGALIALPDGLMVASCISAELNGDTLAAFLPQIFGKISQCTKELRMGELNNVAFTVGNVPWKIFRVNAIFFAAFGRTAEPLPTAQLAALANELDHKPK